MWPFKKKVVIKESRKVQLYGRHRGNSSNYSVWDNMSFIEKFCMVFLPVMLGFIFYMMCDIIYTDMIWWLRLIISVGMVAGLIGLITLIVNFFSERY